MSRRAEVESRAGKPRVLPRAPQELTNQTLVRLGEGIGKVVYASQQWVVKRERTPSEILALIVVWKLVRSLERHTPGDFARRLLEHPSRQIRLLRYIVHALVLVVPSGVWFTSHAGEMWRIYRKRDRRGEGLARQRLAGTELMPEVVTFPPAKVRVGGWPGWLTISEATERVESTLYQRLNELAAAGRYEEMERWLARLLETRRQGWQHGVFSIDSHLKNYGVTGDRIVLLDTGGLTNHWHEIESRLSYEDEVEQPHLQLGLGHVLHDRPDVAGRLNRRWKSAVNRNEVLRNWPTDIPA